MIVALAVLLSAGAAAAAMRRGGVIESRGATGEPTREFRAPPRRTRVAPVKRPSVDSLAASVGDSVALLIGRPPANYPAQPPVQYGPSSESQEVNVPAPLQRRDPLARQIQQMLPDTREADARARIDSATRKDARPNSNTRTGSPPR